MYSVLCDMCRALCVIWCFLCLLVAACCLLMWFDGCCCLLGVAVCRVLLVVCCGACCSVGCVCLLFNGCLLFVFDCLLYDLYGLSCFLCGMMSVV